MRKSLIIAVTFLIIGLGGGWLIFKSDSSEQGNKERKILYYQDPMNPANTSPTPKKAPDGMDFVPVYEKEKSSSGEKKIAYYQDPMHPWFTSDKPGTAPDCGMDLVPVYEGESDAKGIKIDPVTVQNIGVKTAIAETRRLSKTIRTTGKVEYDETKVYSVNTKIMGWVEKLFVDYTGKYVSKGQPLMEIYSPELVSTQEEYLQAIRYSNKMSGSTSAEAQKGANDLVQSAKRRLLYWDISEKEIEELEERGSPTKTMTIYSPVNGIVIDKMVLKGQNVMAGMELYKIADLSTIWVQADVYQYELAWVKLGQPVDLELSYLPGKNYKGYITYIYPYLGMETKTIKVRIEVKNTTSIEFKQGMFATVKIKSPIVVNTVSVPEQAVIRSGERSIVVIALGGGYFDPREVKLGVSADGYIQILEGIKEGEKIVVSSQFLIDSESNLKAAIDQMRGHEGMDMSKPMDESQKNNPGDVKEENMNSNKMNNDQMQEDKTTDMKEHNDSSPLVRTGVIDLQSIDKNKDGKLYQDLMDWNVISDKPGKCPLCGMELKEFTIDEVKANLDKHGFEYKK
ncbi:MAG: efflux RND transporter periplasmic adaptor subunit [Ignavibacterium sp.]|jgi:RND family efflux transporter MFP subunit|nr:efflux RND transporter periplasmic adaptor subunit [Ignavibacterium sp.]